MTAQDPPRFPAPVTVDGRYAEPPPRPPRGPSVHDGLAVAAMVFAFFFPPLGIILGCVSVHAAHRDGRQASGLAVAGLVLGALFLVAAVIGVIAFVMGQPDAAQRYMDCVQRQVYNPGLVCTP